jgi:hypothetical protein
VLHEYVFGIAGGRVRGYQLAFFMLQGLGVVLTMRMRPRGGLALLCRSLTFLFVLGSSVLFFASLQAIVPFYSRGLPRWMW